METFSTFGKVSILTLMEEIKPVVLREHEFDYREKLELKSAYWNFWIIKNLIQERTTFQ